MAKDNYIKGSTLSIVDDNFNSLECYVAYSNNQFAIVVLEDHEKDLSADLFFSFRQIKELVPDFIEERLLEENEHYLIVRGDRADPYNYRELYCKVNNVPSLDVGCNFPTRQLGYLIDSKLVYKGADNLAVLKVYDGEEFDVMMEDGYDKDDFLLLYSDFHDEVEIDSSRFYYLLVDMNSGVIIDLYSYLSYIEEAVSQINPDYEIVDEDGTIRIHKTLYDDFDSSGDQITASLRGCLVMIIKHSTGMDGMMESIYRLEDIPADLLMKSLNATDYYEMMNMLKERYNNWYSFDEILTLLKKDNIPFHETKDFCNLSDECDFD